ncbi:MAG: triose-phosphate isomerase [Bacteroidales bacterium]
MRKKLVAGNWKMNMTFQEGIELINKLLNQAQNIPQDVELLIAPPYIHTSEAARLLKDGAIYLGAQNCSQFDGGAYTGEISARMLRSCGVSHVILGHSERRAYFHEDSDMLKDKLSQALHNQLTPILCCGEQLEERTSDNHFKTITKQLENVLFHFSPEELQTLIIAYEPVWAIGTGKTASPEQAQEMHAHIRQLVNNKFGQSFAENITILYGGSCKPSNAKELFAKPDVDGGLIGGASLKPDDFMAIAKSFPHK